MVVQTAYLGDVVFTAPLVRALKRRFLTAQLTMVVAPRGEAVARHLPGVDAVCVLDKGGSDRALAQTWKRGRALEAELVVVPHPSTRSALFARAIPGAYRVGPDTFPQRLLYDLPVALGSGTFVEQSLSLARALGAAATPELHLTVSEEALSNARRVLGKGRFASVVVGSEWATKRLPPPTWAELGDALLARGITPVLHGAPKERPLAEAILSASTQPQRYRSFVGNGVEEALALLAASSVAIGGDTGLVHAARALGVPTVAFFGPTDPARHLWEPATAVVRLGLACSPCHPHGPAVCPLGHHDCLRKLPAAQLLAAVEARL